MSGWECLYCMCDDNVAGVLCVRTVYDVLISTKKPCHGTYKHDRPVLSQSTQSGNGHFLAYIPSWWWNQPSLVRVEGACTPTLFHSNYHHEQNCGTLHMIGPVNRTSTLPYFSSTYTVYVLCEYSTEGKLFNTLRCAPSVLMEIIFMQMYHNNSIFSEENLQPSGTSKEDL